MKYELKKVLPGHAAAVYALCLDESGSRIFSGSADQMVGAWNSKELEADGFSVKLEAPVFALYKSGNLLFVGQGLGGVHIIDLASKQEVRHLKYHTRPIFDITAHPTQSFLYFSGGDGVLSIVNSSDFSLSWSLPLSEDKLRSICLNSAADKLFVGSSDGYIRILETDYYNVLDEIKAHEGGVYDMGWMSANVLLTVGRDGHIRVWKYVDKKLVEKESIPAHNFAIYSIDISPSGQYFATASRDKTVKIWSLKDLKNPLRISRKGGEGHTHSVNRVKWISDSLLVSAGDDRELHVWSISSP